MKCSVLVKPETVLVNQISVSVFSGEVHLSSTHKFSFASSRNSDTEKRTACIVLRCSFCGGSTKYQSDKHANRKTSGTCHTQDIPCSSFSDCYRTDPRRGRGTGATCFTSNTWHPNAGVCSYSSANTRKPSYPARP